MSSEREKQNKEHQPIVSYVRSRHSRVLEHAATTSTVWEKDISPSKNRTSFRKRRPPGRPSKSRGVFTDNEGR